MNPSNSSTTPLLTPTQILDLREEYYTTKTPPLDLFLQGHNLLPMQLPGCNKWNKPAELILQPQATLSTQGINLDELEKAKGLILTRAVGLLGTDNKVELTVKEFKDVVSIIDTIDKQVKGETQDKPENTIQVFKLLLHQQSSYRRQIFSNPYY